MASSRSIKDGAEGVTLTSSPQEVEIYVVPIAPDTTQAIKNSTDNLPKHASLREMASSGPYENIIIPRTGEVIRPFLEGIESDDNDDDAGDDNYDADEGATQEIEAATSMLRYLQNHYRKELEDVSKEVKLKLDNRKGRVVFRGKGGKLDSAVKAINGLLQNIEQESFTINRTRVLDFLTSRLGQEKLARIEEVTQTTLDVGEGLYAFIEPENEIDIRVIQGDIAEGQTDVLVDTVGPDLTLSDWLLKAGGRQLQTQCNMLYPDGVKEDDVVKTFGGLLNCKQVYYCCLRKWNGNNFKDLVDILFLCLTDAASSGHRSITLPALGTGHLGYPAEKVARLMVTGIKNLLDKVSCLETVTVVIDPRDSATKECFNVELQKKGADPVTVKVTENEIGIGDMVMKIRQGDITAEDTDAIVNSTDCELTLTKGPLSMAISRACGEDIHNQCMLKVAEMKKDGVVVTSAPRIPARWILHASVHHFNGNIKELVKTCLETAAEHNMTSVSFPLLGTGCGLVPVEQMCKVLLTALREHDGNNSSLLEIRVVIFEREKHRLFLEKLREIVAKTENEKAWKRVWSRKNKVSRRSLYEDGSSKSKSRQRDVSPTAQQVGDRPDYLVLCNADGRTEEAEVTIYSPSRENRKRAFEEIQKLCDHHIIELTFHNLKLAALWGTHMRRLKKLLKGMKMKIVVYPDTGKVQVEGLRDAVISFKSHLNDVIDSLLKPNSQ